jgi:ribonuclease HI
VQALVRVLETDPDPEAFLEIKTDSRYSINCQLFILTFFPFLCRVFDNASVGLTQYQEGWKRNGWKTATGAPVKNVDLLKYLIHLLARRPTKVQFTHVRGHQGHYGNERADRLANEGALLPEVEDRDLLREIDKPKQEEEKQEQEEEDGGLATFMVEIQESDLLSPEELENLEF